MKNTLNDFKNQGVVPDMVQVGNETTGGFIGETKQMPCASSFPQAQKVLRITTVT